MKPQYLSHNKKSLAQPELRTSLPKNIAQPSLHPIEQLQGLVGNRATNQLLANQPTLQAKPMFRGLSQELVVQPKLAIGAVGDKYEQEADRVAANVVNKIHAPRSQVIQVQAKSDLIQRVDTVQEESDDIFDYGENFSEKTVNQQVVLKKDKTLYKNKGRDAIKDLKKGSFVEVLETPTSGGWLSKSWAKIKVENDKGFLQGWINTKNAIDKPASGKIIQHESAGVIMPKGKPKIDDIKQMKFGDCFLLAALMSLVQKQPDFVKNSLFVTDPTIDEKQHKLRFFKVEKQSSSKNYGVFDAFINAKFTPEYVTVNNTVLKFKTKIETPSRTVEEGTNVGSAGNQSWPAIVEKAFAKWPGKNQSAFSQETGLMAGGKVQNASMFIMGQGYQPISTYDSGMSEDRQAKIKSGLASNHTEAGEKVARDNRVRLKAKIIDTFQSNSNTLICAGTKQEPPEEWLRINDADGTGSSGESKVGGIVFRHAYSIEGANDIEIQLRNPWGRYSRVNGKVEDNEAVSILNWDEFFQVFATVSLGVQ